MTQKNYSDDINWKYTEEIQKANKSCVSKYIEDWYQYTYRYKDIDTFFNTGRSINMHKDKALFVIAKNYDQSKYLIIKS